jgi:hypothetical protein
MAVPNIFAGTAGGTTAQLDANFAYFADAIAVDAGNVGLPSVISGWKLAANQPGSDLVRLANTSGVGVKLQMIDTVWVGEIEMNGGSLIFKTAGSTERMRIDTSGNTVAAVPTTPPALTTNGTMVMNLTSNTNLRISVRGSDGTTRVANITLA